MFVTSLCVQGKSDCPQGMEIAGTIDVHSTDLASVVATEIPQPPVAVGHSVGGLIIQRCVCSCVARLVLGVYGCLVLGVCMVAWSLVCTIAWS